MVIRQVFRLARVAPAASKLSLASNCLENQASIGQLSDGGFFIAQLLFHNHFFRRIQPFPHFRYRSPKFTLGVLPKNGSMGPLTSIAAPLAVIGSTVDRIAQFAAEANPFAALMSESSPTDALRSEAGKDIDGQNDRAAAETLLTRIASQLSQLFGKGVPLDGEPLELELSPLGDVYVLGTGLESRQFEMAINDQPELLKTIQEYVELSGNRRLRFDRDTLTAQAAAGITNG